MCLLLTLAAPRAMAIPQPFQAVVLVNTQEASQLDRRTLGPLAMGLEL